MRESQHEHMYSITCPLAHGPWPLRTYGDTEPRDDYSKRAPTAREHLQQESTYSRRAPTAKQGKQKGGGRKERDLHWRSSKAKGHMKPRSAKIEGAPYRKGIY